MTVSGKAKTLVECVLVALVILVAFHCIKERIDHRDFPSGDEGSWLSVAAEVSRGHCFTTQRLEYLFLSHWDLPRPDDFRYPGLVLALAAAFKVFGISYTVALWTVAAIFILFCCALYYTLRKCFGAKTALITLTLTALSLMQLYWNTQVYTEGLFGLILSLLVLCSVSFRPEGWLHWVAVGALAGLLYLVRPNAVLFAPAIIVAGIWYFFTRKIRPQNMFFALAAMAVVMLPWCARMWLIFGNPFHVAGSAGLLRASLAETPLHDVRAFLYFSGLFFPLKATVVGAGNMAHEWNFFEHGLHWLPLAFALVALLRKRTFYNPVVSAGFVLSFSASCYAGYLYSWAAVRYFSPFAPFVYAYGIREMVLLFELAIKRFAPRAATVAGPVVLAACLVPVVNPHRYYERTLGSTPATDRSFSGYVGTVDRLCGENEVYCARSLAQLNFLCNRNCVVMQWFFDSTKVDTVAARLRPRLVALTAAEDNDTTLKGIMKRFAVVCGNVRLAEENSFGRFYLIGCGIPAPDSDQTERVRPDPHP